MTDPIITPLFSVPGFMQPFAGLHHRQSRR